jgi:putative endonuclease
MDAAARYLTGCGFTVLDRNWQHPGGTIDSVARDRRALVGCIAKTRRGRSYASPLQPAKLKRMRGLVAAWVNAHGMRADEIRIDVVSVIREGTGFTIEHVREAG